MRIYFIHLFKLDPVTLIKATHCTVADTLANYELTALLANN